MVTRVGPLVVAVLGRLFDCIPTGVLIALLLGLVIGSLATSVQQVTATFVALFSSNDQRADRAVRVLRALREPSCDHPPNAEAPTEPSCDHPPNAEAATEPSCDHTLDAETATERVRERVHVSSPT